MDICNNNDVTITIFGETRSGKAISRSSSKLGDYLYVSGILGLPKIGLDNFNLNYKEFELAKNKYLLPDTTASEQSTALDILSHGFKLRTTGGNQNGSAVYYYAAFAEEPTVGSNNTPCTAR